MMTKDYEMPGEIRAWGTYVPDEAIESVSDVLRSKWLNTGKKEKQLREAFCKKFNAPHCVAVSSGTAALRTTYAMLGIGPGDEVVSTPYTFIATNTAILEQGATPVFADIRYDDLNIDPQSIEDQITGKTKAIVVVHYAGNPVDLDEIRQIAAAHQLPLIEDSAHALGSKYKTKYIGETGELLCYSLQVVKIVTCGDGGLVVTSRDDYYEELKKRVWYGVDRDRKRGQSMDPLPEEIDVLGFKHNMNDITASLAIAGVNHFNIALERRRQIGTQYRQELADLEKVRLLPYYEDREPNYQIFPIHVEAREKFAEFMWSKSIEVVVNNRRNDRYKIFCGLRDLPNLKRADEDTILLPMHFDLRDEDVNRIIEAVCDYDRM